MHIIEIMKTANYRSGFRICVFCSNFHIDSQLIKDIQYIRDLYRDHNIYILNDSNGKWINEYIHYYNKERI